MVYIAILRRFELFFMTPTFHKAPQSLRPFIYGNSLTRIPCVYDGLSARMAEQVGFPAIAFSGNAVSASLLGLPDLGILGMHESVQHASRVAQSLSVPLLCDADTGYGGVMNVIRTVREYEAFGIAGIYIEDQVTPKRCGLLPDGIPVITKQEQLIKLKAAVEARQSKEFMIIARTDAKSMFGLEEATLRARSYIEAGADAALVMGACTPQELKYVASIVKAPLVTVIQETPPTTELTDELLNEVGCTLAMHAGIARYAVVRALKDVFSALHKDGSTSSVRSKMASFDEYNQVLDLKRWLEIEDHYLNNQAKD